MATTRLQEEHVMTLVTVTLAEGAAYEAIDGTPTTREDLGTQAPVRGGDPARRAAR